MRKIRSSQKNRILVARTDRIGDVLLSTPVFEVLKKNYPQSEITVLVKPECRELVDGLESVDHVMTFDVTGRHQGWKGLMTLIRELREQNFRIGICLQSHWKVAAAVFAAGISHRVGPLSKMHSYLFYNRGLRQRRSHVEMHETDYNLQLLRRLGIRVGVRNYETKVAEVKTETEKAKDWLTENGRNFKKKLIAVHPGMGGSALNWPENHYVELIQSLVKDGLQVVVTTGPTESPLSERIFSDLGDMSEKVMFCKGQYSLQFLRGIFSFADVVVAPSTGPLHLAVALKKPVVTFYPPIRVQSAIRWGPYVNDESTTSVLVPENYCGQDFDCLGNICHYYPCMKSLTVNQALKEVWNQLEAVNEKTKTSKS